MWSFEQDQAFHESTNVQSLKESETPTLSGMIYQSLSLRLGFKLPEKVVLLKS
jgi:hypothetical protein